MVMGYWSVAILFWQLSINRNVNVLCWRCGLAKTPLRHPSLPFDSLPYPTRTICRRVRMYQTKRGWPHSISMRLCPTREPCYKVTTRDSWIIFSNYWPKAKLMLLNNYSTILTEPEVNNSFSILTRGDLKRIRKETIKKLLVWLTGGGDNIRFFRTCSSLQE